ncbi:uncharacterized protein LOC6605587 isoform X2 [Drosophila sechellia]|uniref:GM25421 n=1 Tax=Drosophila sechellia TaxID=7238 RepID=B4HGT4_DROSE|nr:uncharacterized protein LOC6605587 isoform X2 [Drosophila sechellia]EDW41392.1 GM25421 [Drosophila sechellia]
MAPPPKVVVDQANASARSNGSSNNNSVGGATGAVPKQQTPVNGAPTSGSSAAATSSRSARSRRQQEHLGEPDLDLVEPETLQRETLKTLNDLLHRARITNAKNRSPAEQQLSSKDHKSPAQQQREALRQLAAEHGTYDTAEQLQEQQQRYRFPVRPVQRVQHQPSSSANSTGAPSSSSALLRLRQSTPPNATVGVVIPNATTSNGNGNLSGNEEQAPPLTPAGLQQLVHRVLGVHHFAPRTEGFRSQVDVLRALLGLDENLNSRYQPSRKVVETNYMVHEINPNSDQGEGVVNSTSLEDVALSEMSDNRAQSIQSLHSVLETPTPDTTPSFDELQQRLEASNRNMQHLHDEQAKLLQIQNLAKSHLNEMERMRQQADSLPHNVNGGEAPKYESVQQVQDDMASLVGRMKNLTAFIHNQNELSTVLGDDGPEILAEQEALQEKLESLRTQREDMRNLVDELNSINRTARETARVIKEKGETPTPPPKPESAPEPPKERVVPVEYQRNVPIIRQEAANAAQRALHAQAMINQKTADIEALKAQMARLKGMLYTVSQIEESTPSMGSTLERRSEERTSVERELPAEIAHRVFALNDVTSELRAEAASLQKERDRILALKAEIERRKQQAAAAVQMGDDALKRSSLTPTPTPMRQQRMTEEEDPSEMDTSLQATPTKEQLRDELRSQCERLRKEYEQKQRELEQRYVASNNTTSEADDEGNDDTDSDKYFANVRTASSATLKRSPSANTVVEQRRGQQTSVTPQQAQPPPPAPPSTLNEDDLNVTLDTLSLGNDSIPSSSNRSQYMPPPMQPVPGMWASHNSGSSWHGQQPVYGQPSSSAGTEFKKLPAGQQVGSSNGSGSNASTDAVLLQQFMQTQQMLINSVCQCNQALWHQQREIDNLNHQLHTLQDRFNVVACQDHSFGLRSESVPPPVGPGMGQMPNNLCLGSSRAQSEQLFNFGAHQSAFSNYQRSCHRSGAESHHHQQQQHQAQPFLNNAAPPPPPTHFNNETPLSPPTYRSSPGPIFMNHHNNTIHQNNSNLRTQNQHANNLHSLPEGAAGGGAPGGGITLNNQVPPGNRANNYWDNFRSHSRQNLLSNKSNEELNVDLQQYRRQRARPSYFQPPQLLPPTTRGGLTHQQQRRHFFESPLTALHGSSSNGSNNLNNSGSSGRKRDWRDDAAHIRDHDDEDVDEVEENHDNVIFGSGRRRNRRRPQLSTLRDEEPEQASSSNLNMNVNYGNSPLYQRNKVPAKPTTSTVSLTPLQQRHLRFDFELPAHYMDYSELPQITLVDSTPTLGQEASPADESNAMEQTEETASEELNRNLLVNALKNDKFTTKFYESIKEDVYRRLETLFEQQQQQQQQQNQQLQQPQEPHGLRKALNQEENERTGDAEATESRSETPLEVMRLQLDNDRPEDEKGTPVKQLSVGNPQNGQHLDEMEDSASAVTSSSRAENEEKILEGKVEQASGSGSGPGTSIELAPDHELIEYIIKRIRNQTHNNTVINDSLLAEVSKLTATAAQNSTASSPLISPKRIYAKIKKMDIPRQRDEFLLWYRSYLEQLFVVEQPQDSCKPKTKLAPSAASPAKQKNQRVRKQSQSQSQDSNNDADLAEADQKNVSSSGNGDLECENNENPGEEADGQAAAEPSGAEEQDVSLE